MMFKSILPCVTPVIRCDVCGKFVAYPVASMTTEVSDLDNEVCIVEVLCPKCKLRPKVTEKGVK